MRYPIRVYVLVPAARKAQADDMLEKIAQRFDVGTFSIECSPGGAPTATHYLASIALTADMASRFEDRKGSITGVAWVTVDNGTEKIIASNRTQVNSKAGQPFTLSELLGAAGLKVVVTT